MEKDPKKIVDGVEAQLKFTESNREKVAELTLNCLGNMLYSKFSEVFEALEVEVKETGGQGQIDMIFKLSQKFQFGEFHIDNLSVKWVRRVGSEDKDFDMVRFDPNQPLLPGIE